ncbi:MAG: hypothetical protein ACREVV_19125 [Steroidobacteraceae bacterium]
MNLRFLCSWAAIAMLSLAACNKAESPAKVQEDVAKASDSAAQKDSKAAEKLASADAAASKNVGAAEDTADARTTNAAVDAVIAQAEGDHKVALAQCESLSGNAQRDCREQADADLDAVKAKVKALKDD